MVHVASGQRDATLTGCTHKCTYTYTAAGHIETSGQRCHLDGLHAPRVLTAAGHDITTTPPWRAARTKCTQPPEIYNTAPRTWTTDLRRVATACADSASHLWLQRRYAHALTDLRSWL